MRIAYLLALLFISVIGFAQAPQRFSFQAVVRHPDTTLVTFKQISVRLSILKGDINGTVVYSETHSPRTNGLGLFTLEVGGGTVQSGDFSSFEWGNDSYFLKREIDPTGGTNYTISGTSQMLSVPYALHAETANKLSLLSKQPNLSEFVPHYQNLSIGIDFNVPNDSTLILSGSYRNNDSDCNFEIDGGILSWINIVPSGKTIKISSQYGNSFGNCDINLRYHLIPSSKIDGEIIAITLKADGTEKYTVPNGKKLFILEFGWCIEFYTPNNDRINIGSKIGPDTDIYIPLYQGEYILSNCQYPNYSDNVKSIQKTTIIGLLTD